MGSIARMKPPYSVRTSFGYARAGIVSTFREGGNFRIQLCGGALAIVLGLVFQISAGEWLAILICCGLVLGGECINTAIEHAVDLACPEKDPVAGAAKDEAAGGVLLFALASLAVGIVIFVPRILALVGITF